MVCKANYILVLCPSCVGYIWKVWFNMHGCWNFRNTNWKMRMSSRLSRRCDIIQMGLSSFYGSNYSIRKVFKSGVVTDQCRQIPLLQAC